MKCTLLLTFVVLLVVCAEDTHAWFGGGGSSRSSSRSSDTSKSSSRSGSSNKNRKSGGGWWGGSRRSSSSRSGSSSVQKQETPKASVIDKVKGAIGGAIDTVKAKTKEAKNYVKGYVNGAKEMHSTYKEMKTVTKQMVKDGKSAKGADKYFHAKANYKAAQHGPGGKAAAKHISDVREAYQTAFQKGKNIVGKVSDKGYNEYAADSAKDQEANRHGQNGGDPNKYRTKDIPDKHKK
ncbi:SAA [Mytilus edulis]|uniref:SAA n=1 Tax=Mytilus edulis TaxID=6550 RepID=A0A8S3RNA6_MYTED|nr:SAA [Mytilus edulis]